jgi:hypothetical protein
VKLFARAAVTVTVVFLYMRELARQRRARREIATWGAAVAETQRKVTGQHDQG